MAKDLITEGERLGLAVTLLTNVKEVSQYLQRSETTVYRWINGNVETPESVLNQLLFKFGISKIFVRTGKGQEKAELEELLPVFHKEFGSWVKTNTNLSEVKNAQLARIVNLSETLEEIDQDLVSRFCIKLFSEKKNRLFRNLISVMFDLPSEGYEDILEAALKVERKVIRKKK
ncbi:DNA-binding protein [Leptospira semungkisensis]|uniref:DNA-binding protein n=1 Tax=Leptospira semungkisensis TaxID=2484985 RepID=A0A4R9FKL8_9LEPT|nr:DNA-binding protein [Leptospira semungkisensis]TGJ99181.1 DNA-binding protein [Leptospira semungkisensis]